VGLIKWMAIIFGVPILMVAIGAGVLWLNARPALDAAVAVSAEDHAPVCPAKDALPAGYPVAPIDVQSGDSAEQAAWRLACKRMGAGACPRTIAAEARYFGFRVFLPLRLNACQVKALSLRPEAPLGAALRRIYPHGPPATISREAALCVRRAASRSPSAALPAVCEGLQGR
jgi:hypothetical protein